MNLMRTAIGSRTRAGLVLAFVALSSTATLAVPPTLYLINGTSSFGGPSTFFQTATGVSPDGSTAYGYGNGLAGPEGGFRWTPAEGYKRVTVSAGPAILDGIFASNADATRFGAVIFDNAYLVTPTGQTVTSYFDFSGIPDNSAVRDMAYDGSYLVGFAGESQQRAARWNAVTRQIQEVGALPGYTRSEAAATNANGSVVVGETAMSSFESTRAFRWVDGVGTQNLGVLPGLTYSSASDVSADGNIVVGSSVSGPSSVASRAFRWTTTDGLEALPLLPGFTRSGASKISGDGFVIAGSMRPATGFAATAVLWTPQGTFTLVSYLTSQGVDLTGWDTSTLYIVGLSHDASVIVGNGRYNGLFRSFYLSGVSIPAPGAAGLLMVAGLAASRRRR